MNKLSGREKEKLIIKWLYDNNVISSMVISKKDILIIYRVDLSGRTNNYWNCIQSFYNHIEKNNLQVTGKRIKYKKEYLLKPTKKKTRKRKKQTKIKKFTGSDFYHSREWRELRVKALVKYSKKCCLCGRAPCDGVILHVDHIKPRSKRPDLELELDNLQILCEDCNLGKSNKYQEDWR